MTRKPARPERRLLLAAAFLALAVSAGPARAAPASLDTDAEMAAFAKQVEAYAGASLARWTVVAPTRAEAEARIAAIAARLRPSERVALANKLVAQADPQAQGAHGYISAQLGAAAPGGGCAWQVWVSDPDLPSADSQTAMLPLASKDKVPVGPKATFRVGHFGLVQSRLYAFDETHPGWIRDLAAVPDVDIPVPQQEDFVVLAAARKPAPFWEGIKAALASSQGERRNLGEENALRKNQRSELVATRGIGANIVAVPSTMIARKSTVVASAQTKSAEPEESLMETCQYTLTPAN